MSEFPYVPYGTTVHGQEEIDAVVHVLRTTTQMSTHVRELESKVAALYDKKYGIGVNSGSSALYLAADLLNYEPGTEILTPALTFSTTVAPLIKKSWVPAFLDVEEGTYNDYAKNQGHDHPQPDWKFTRLESVARNRR
jgi:CDP-6-deoxy-D-xylo-4-hexulose-3-dehydrase